MSLSFGITNARSVSFGSAAVKSMWFGNTKFYPSGGSYTIALSKYSDTYTSAGTSADVIYVTASTVNWSLSSSVGWITVQKVSNTEARITVSANNSSERTGTVIFTVNNVEYARFTATQQARYEEWVLNILTANPYLISSATTNFTVSMNSYHGSTAVQPNYIITQNRSNVSFASSANPYGNFYQFSFNCDANTDTQSKINYITFSQSGGQSRSMTITQNPRYAPATIEGFSVRQTYGEWQLGTFLAGYTNIDDRMVPIRAMAILNANNVEGVNYTLSLDCDFYTIATDTPSYSTYTNTFTQSAGKHDIVDGGTGYGFSVMGGPNLTITNVRTFTVTLA